MAARSWLDACDPGSSDLEAAESWISACDPRPFDLLADTAYRVARGSIDTARGQFPRVLHVLGAIAVSHAYVAEVAVLRAHAWERLGQKGVAVGELLHLEREVGPLAIRRARRFIAAHPGWKLCTESAPVAQTQARSLRAQHYDRHLSQNRPDCVDSIRARARAPALRA